MVGSGPGVPAMPYSESGASRGLAQAAKKGINKRGITSNTRAARMGRRGFTGLLSFRLGRRGKPLDLVAVLLNHRIGQQLFA